MATILSGLILSAIRASQNLRGNRSGAAVIVGHPTTQRLVMLSPIPFAWWDHGGQSPAGLPLDGSELAAWRFGGGFCDGVAREPLVITFAGKIVGERAWWAWQESLPRADDDVLRGWGGWETVRQWESFGTVASWVRRLEERQRQGFVTL